MDINTSEVSSYKTAFVSSLHLSGESVDILRTMANNPVCWFTHAVTVAEAMENAFILRFKAMAGDEWEDVEDGLKEHGFSSEFIALIDALAQADFDAVHFDRDMDLLPGAIWYTPDGSRVIPLAYDSFILSYHDLDDAQRAAVLENLDETEEQAEENSYFICEDIIYSMADMMRLDDNSELKSFGFAAHMGESNTSAIFIALSDDSDRVDVVRVG